MEDFNKKYDLVLGKVYHTCEDLNKDLLSHSGIINKILENSNRKHKTIKIKDIGRHEEEVMVLVKNRIFTKGEAINFWKNIKSQGERIIECKDILGMILIETNLGFYRFTVLKDTLRGYRQHSIYIEVGSDEQMINDIAMPLLKLRDSDVDNIKYNHDAITLFER